MIDMTEYKGIPEDYATLSEFFIRPLDPVNRSLRETPECLVSPSDGVFSSLETVYRDEVTQVKGVTYSLSDFLKRELDFSSGYHVAVIYLSPANYHRYHYPLKGRVDGYCHAHGRLYPVNRLGLDHIKGLFIRNERIITEMTHTPASTGGSPFKWYMTAVGATNVGSIKMEFIQDSPPLDVWISCGKEAGQLQEMGRFEMGSTIVMVVPASLARPIPERVGKPIRVGEPIFYLT